MPYWLKGRIWIESEDGTFLGYGRVVLLERIKEHGSISAAARSMQMSYRHAWKLVNSMNSQSKTPLVTTSIGGRKGGGAVLTQTGSRAITCFWAAYKDHNNYISAHTEQLTLR